MLHIRVDLSLLRASLLQVLANPDKLLQVLANPDKLLQELELRDRYIGDGSKYWTPKYRDDFRPTAITSVQNNVFILMLTLESRCTLIM